MNEATEPTGTSGAWTPELMAAHKARIEFMGAMGQSHFSRTDAQWHVAHFAKTVGMELEAENAKLRADLQGSMATVAALQMSLDSAKLQLGEATRKGESLCEAYGTLLLACRKLDSTWRRACTYDSPEILELRKLLEPVTEKPRGNA